MLKRIILLWLVFVVFISKAQSTPDVRNSTYVYGSNAISTLGSARYIGMGGAMGAIGGEISASNINPAGTGVYITGDFFGSMYINSYRNTSTLHGNSVSYTKSLSNLGQIGGVISFPIDGKWKFVNVGFNYTEQDLDNYVETGYSRNIGENVTNRIDKPNLQDMVRFNGHGYSMNGSLSKINISMGGNYENKMYLGFGINLHSSDFYQGDSYELIYDSDNKVAVYDRQYSPYNEYASGTSLSVGTIFKVWQILRLGVAVESPIWWNTEREYTEYEKDNSSKIITKPHNRERNDFSSQARVTFSSAIIPSKYFAFNVDYSRGFYRPTYVGNITKSGGQLNTYFNNFYQSLSEFKLGAEYRYSMFRLRGGYSIEENPYKKEAIPSLDSEGISSKVVYNNLYIGKRNTLGLGIGFDFKLFYLDIAYQNTFYEYNNPFHRGKYAVDSSIANEIRDRDDAIVSFVKNKQNNIFVTLGAKF